MNKADGPGSRRGGAGRARPRGGRRSHDEHLFGRDEAPARRRSRHRPPAGRPVPRRADDRSRPAGPRPDVGRDPPPARGGHDRLPDDALPRGGRRAGRPAGDHRPREDRRRGHGRRAQAPGRRRRRHPRASTGRPSTSSRRSADSRSSARRPARTASSGCTSIAARPPCRSSSASSTGPGWRPRRSPSIGPASTTSSSSRPAARCATRRRPDPHDQERNNDMKLMRDTWLIFRRSLVLTLRQPVWIVFGMMVPVLYLVLFGPLLEGAVDVGRRRHERVQLVRARADHPDRDLRDGVRRLRADRRAAQRRRRADARDADEPGVDAPRPVASRRRHPDGPGDDHDRARDPVRVADRCR